MSTLTKGTRLGHYVIDASLDAGGMGEVCRAPEQIEGQLAWSIAGIGFAFATVLAFLMWRSANSVETSQFAIAPPTTTDWQTQQSSIAVSRVAADGRRFLPDLAQSEERRQFMVVLNWRKRLQ